MRQDAAEATPELLCRTCATSLQTCAQCQTPRCACLACLCSFVGDSSTKRSPKKRGRKVSPPGPQPEQMGAVGFGKRLAWARRRCGLSLDQLSLTAGYCKNTLRSYERGLLIGGPPLNTVEELAQTLGVLGSWLAFGMGSADQRHTLWARVRSRLDEIDFPER